MKKYFIVTILLSTLVTFAQKDELKSLNKIYSKDRISEKDLAEYKRASDALNNNASSESDKVYARFYSVVYPTVVLSSKGSDATLQDQMKLYNPEFIKEYGRVIDETVAFEQKTGNKLYSDALLQEKKGFLDAMLKAANQLNEAKKYKESALMFYNAYLFDKKNQGQSLQNAAILSVNSEDYKFAEKMYEEFIKSDYLNHGILFYAKSKANDSETLFNSLTERTSAIRIGTHESPRDEKMSDKKADTYKLYAIIVSQNGDTEKTKAAYLEAFKLNPNDQEIKDGLMPIYFNEAFEIIKGEAAIVDKINANRDNPEKYDAFMKERVDLYKKALPLIEKAYELKPSDENAKALIKVAYDIIGMKEKAAKIK